MLFTPDKSFKILTDEEFASSINAITDSLSECRVNGSINGVGGVSLNYEYYLCADATASVVIVHGLSEFTAKYYETCYYLLNSGYNVFIYDQRCHGFSGRLTDQVDLIHVDSFDDYANDLALFIDNVVCTVSNLPIYIYSHSMGGAVTVLYLAEHSDKVAKAVLAAPLFDPNTGKTPHHIALVGTWAKATFAGNKSMFQVTQRFNPEAALDNSTDESRNRFVHNLNLRRYEPMYQSTPMTSGWVYNSLKLRSKMRRRKLAERIKIPILMISGTLDSVVMASPQERFAAKCDSCERVVIDGATHSILTCSHEIITDYLTRVLEFYRR